VPDHQLPQLGMPAVDAMRLIIAGQLAAERGWMVAAYTLPPNAQHVKIMRALVKETLSHALAATLADDIAEACDTLEKKGGLHPAERRRVKTGAGY
jgi:glutamate decarboxylase